MNMIGERSCPIWTIHCKPCNKFTQKVRTKLNYLGNIIRKMFSGFEKCTPFVCIFPIYKNRKKSNLYSRTLSGHGKNRLLKNSRTHGKKPTEFLLRFQVK